MTNEEIKKLADSYYAGTRWLDKNQENDTKFGWRTGFAYMIRQAKNISSNLPVSGSLPNYGEIWYKARELKQYEFYMWMNEKLGNDR